MPKAMTKSVLIVADKTFSMVISLVVLFSRDFDDVRTEPAARVVDSHCHDALVLPFEPHDCDIRNGGRRHGYELAVGCGDRIPERRGGGLQGDVAKSGVWNLLARRSQAC